MAEESETIWKFILRRIAEVGGAIRNGIQMRDPRDTVGFSIAFIALAAKLAKADGVVTRDEVRAFRTVFEIPPSEEENAARVFDLCRQDVAGYRSYARKMEAMFQKDSSVGNIRRDVLDGLFHIAMADGEYHPAEQEFIREVSRIFGLDEAAFRMLEARHVPDVWNPCAVLGLSADAAPEEIDRAWRRAARENHPDVLRARGLPEEMMAIATARMIDINRARDALQEKSDLRI